MASLNKRKKRQLYRARNHVQRKQKKIMSLFSNDTSSNSLIKIDQLRAAVGQNPDGMTYQQYIKKLLSGIVGGAIEGGKTGAMDVIVNDPNVKKAAEEAAKKKASTTIGDFVVNNLPTMGIGVVFIAGVLLLWKGAKKLFKK